MTPQEFKQNLRYTVWWLGNGSWVYGLIDRSTYFLTSHDPLAIGQILVASSVFLCWLTLKPYRS